MSEESKQLPNGLSEEKRGTNLAALATTNALAQLSDVVLGQWRHTKEFSRLAKHGIRPVDRLLFYGAPGNGKTMSAQWLAAKIDCPLYRVRCEMLVDCYLGDTAKNISAVMQWLTMQPKCVVLFDEVEQIFQARGGKDNSKAGRELGSAMTIFWQFLDRWEAPTLFVLATNLPHQLDAALLSRIDMKMEFGPPTTEQVANVLHYWQEVLHEYGGQEWGPRLLERTNYESFRALFHEVQACVRAHVVNRRAD